MATRPTAAPPSRPCGTTRERRSRPRPTGRGPSSEPLRWSGVAVAAEGEAGQPGLDPALALDRSRQAWQVCTCAQARSASSGDSWPSSSALTREPRCPITRPPPDRTVRSPGRRSATRPSCGRAVGQRRAQHRAAAVDPRADGAELGAEDLGDLVVGEALDVAEHDRGAEVRRQRGQRALDVVVEGPVGVRPRRGSGALLVRRSARSSDRASKRIRCLRRAWSRKRLVVIRCSQPSNVPGV